jgi:hypothetical protein
VTRRGDRRRGGEERGWGRGTEKVRRVRRVKESQRERERKRKRE